jgi:hypothetical protein
VFVGDFLHRKTQKTTDSVNEYGGFVDILRSMELFTATGVKPSFIDSVLEKLPPANDIRQPPAPL